MFVDDVWWWRAPLPLCVFACAVALRIELASYGGSCANTGADLGGWGLGGLKAPAVDFFAWLPVGGVSTKTGHGTVSLI